MVNPLVWKVLTFEPYSFLVQLTITRLRIAFHGRGLVCSVPADFPLPERASQQSVCFLQRPLSDVKNHFFARRRRMTILTSLVVSITIAKHDSNDVAVSALIRSTDLSESFRRVEWPVWLNRLRCGLVVTNFASTRATGCVRDSDSNPEPPNSHGSSSLPSFALLFPI